MRANKEQTGNPLGLAIRDEAFNARPDGNGRAAFALERWLLQAMLRALGNPAVELVLWDGSRINAAEHGPTGIRLHLRDPGAVYRLALDPLYQFGELYSCGRIQVEGNLVTLIETINTARGDRTGWSSRLLSRVHAPRSNLLGQSPANIHHHYDLGNEFYEQWLDRRMLYTCAYFPSPPLTLEDAQVAKMDHICRKLRLQPGECVIEAGCGWGALALHMAREYGVRVYAYNLSREQIAYARNRARDEGLDDRVKFVEADYRVIRGQYDVFVSVGMLEHVGPHHFQEFSALIDRCVGANGRGLIHAIGSNHASPLNPWIERRIFPGAYPPPLSEMVRILEPVGMSVLDVENLRLHYARTLEHWLSRYESAREYVETNFGAEFFRAWRLYLAGSLAAFRSGRLQLFQVLFQRQRSNQQPWTRAALYRDELHP